MFFGQGQGLVEKGFDNGFSFLGVVGQLVFELAAELVEGEQEFRVLRAELLLELLAETFGEAWAYAGG